MKKSGLLDVDDDNLACSIFVTVNGNGFVFENAVHFHFSCCHCEQK